MMQSFESFYSLVFCDKFLSFVGDALNHATRQEQKLAVRNCGGRNSMKGMSASNY